MYDVMRPWIRVHPNVGLYDRRANVCPTCGSNKLVCRGTERTLVQEYVRLQCKDCGKWSRRAEPLIKPTERSRIVRSVS
jgi:transcription elongation factor Elf1